MSKHTPGPWIATHSNNNDLDIRGGEDNRVVGGCGCCGSPSGNNFEYDIPLICAAPDMLEALKKARLVLNLLLDASCRYHTNIQIFGKDGGSYLTEIDTVIAKAGGGDEA